MKPLTEEWVQKAEGDFATAQREVRARKSPNYDSAGFHAQQCVEKYLKARLQESGIAFPFTHDLEALLRLVLPIQPLWSALMSDAKTLSQHAVKARYPGSSVTKAQAKELFAMAQQFRALVRQNLGLPM
jgi:HEPN domain-containing protein